MGEGKHRASFAANARARLAGVKDVSRSEFWTEKITWRNERFNVGLKIRQSEDRARSRRIELYYVLLSQLTFWCGVSIESPHVNIKNKDKCNITYFIIVYSSVQTISSGLCAKQQILRRQGRFEFWVVPLQAHYNGSNPAIAGISAMTYSSIYSSTCWEWADIVLTWVLSISYKVTADVTWGLGVAEMFFCANIQLQWGIWKGRWCHRPMVSYIKMICRRWGIKVFLTKMACGRRGKSYGLSKMISENC
jgi:hypothetical protein